MFDGLFLLTILKIAYIFIFNSRKQTLISSFFTFASFSSRSSRRWHLFWALILRRGWLFGSGRFIDRFILFSFIPNFINPPIYHTFVFNYLCLLRFLASLTMKSVFIHQIILYFLNFIFFLHLLGVYLFDLFLVLELLEHVYWFFCWGTNCFYIGFVQGVHLTWVGTLHSLLFFFFLLLFSFFPKFLQRILYFFLCFLIFLPVLLNNLFHPLNLNHLFSAFNIFLHNLPLLLQHFQILHLLEFTFIIYLFPQLFNFIFLLNVSKYPLFLFVEGYFERFIG